MEPLLPKSAGHSHSCTPHEDDDAGDQDYRTTVTHTGSEVVITMAPTGD